MLIRRRTMRPLAVACATAAVVAVPSAAQARPALDPPAAPSPDTQAPAAQQSASPIVREIRTDGDTTLALLLSGSALLIAAGCARLAGHDHRRIGNIAQPR